MSKQIKWISYTGILTAVLIALQALTTALTANQFITGSIVNFILAITVLLIGYSSGVTIAIIAPITAILVGHLAGNAVLAPTIPFIAIGNLVFVILFRLIALNKKNDFNVLRFALGGIVSSVLKFASLYLLIVKIAIPFILRLPSPQKELVGTMFTFPQLITALIGAFFAILIYPVLKKAIKY